MIPVPIPNPRDIQDWIAAATDVLKLFKEVKDDLPHGSKREEAVRKLADAEAALANTKANMAKLLGYELCLRHFPPGIMIENHLHIVICNTCGKQRNLTAEAEESFSIHLKWQWMNYPKTCIDGLRDSDFIALKAGQDNNPAIQILYRQIYEALPRRDFWQLVATTSSYPADFFAFASDIEYQVREARKTVESALATWNQDSAEPKGENYRALALLLAGQSHNPYAMSIYRSCYRVNPEKMIEMIEDRIKVG